MALSEIEILEELDTAFNGISSKNFPVGRPEDIKCNFFMDLEHGYVATAGNRIHLYSDAVNWAVVFEKNGYNNRGICSEIELIYIGNCIEYLVEKGKESNYISNMDTIPLIEAKEFARIENRIGEGAEIFELISTEIKEIIIRNKPIVFDNNHRNYENVGIIVREYDNPNHLIGFGDLVRYIHETSPDTLKATEEEIKQQIMINIPKLMSIEEFHYESVYDEVPPSLQETFNLIAKILVTGDVTHWKPKEKPNNSWKNWLSGNL